MKAIININGDIGDLGNPDFTDLFSVIKQFSGQKEADSVEVRINSPGGLVSEGWEIYDYIKSLGIPVRTVGHNVVASMATVIFMAGEERVLMPNTSFGIHLPIGGVDGNSEDISGYYDEIKEIEDRMVKFYSDVTGITKEGIRPLMVKEMWLDTDQALELGFSNISTPELRAVAHFNKSNFKNKVMDKTKIKKAFDNLMASIGLEEKKPLMILVQDASGSVEIDFFELSEGQSYQIGDKASIGGTPANGEFTLPDGTVLLFVEGSLTEITEVTEVSQEMLDMIEQMMLKDSELETVNAKLKEKEDQVLALQNKIKDVENKVAIFKKQLPVGFFQERVETVEEVSDAKKMLNKLKNKK